MREVKMTVTAVFTHLELCSDEDWSEANRDGQEHLRKRIINDVRKDIENLGHNITVDDIKLDIQAHKI